MKNKTITLEEAVNAYKDYLAVQGKTLRTLYTYGKDLDQVQKFFGRDRELSSILKQHVGKFIKSPDLLALPDGSPRAEQTVKKTFRVMRMFFYWAQNEGWITDVPIPQNAKPVIAVQPAE